MDIQQIFDLGIKMGVKADPRGVNGVKKHLAGVKKEYDKMSAQDKKYFDKERLAHPYADSRIHVANKKTQVKRVMVGIDIGESEILLASQLNERGKHIDCVIAHHPVGKSLSTLHEVMDMQVETFQQAGVPVHIAEKLMDERIDEVGRGVHGVNHHRVVDMAQLLKVNFMNMHTTTDNLVWKFLDTYLRRKKPETLGDVVDLLLEIPEYQEARRRGAGPKICSGSPKSRVGNFTLSMTGGTSTTNKMYKELSHYGISTLIDMHMKEASHTAAKEHHMNIVIAGHMASDSLGVNLFLDELEKKGMEIIACGGFMRVSRIKK